MQLFLHQTHHKIADFTAIKDTLQEIMQSADTKVNGLHLFPELFLTGYPLKDLCFDPNFIDRYQKLLSQINEFSSNQAKNPHFLALLGGLDYTFDDNGLPLIIENVIFALTPGTGLKRIYSKQLLPNYDIFDEKKYFSPGKEATIISFAGKNIGVLICEDMWHSSHHSEDPTGKLAQKAQDDQTPLDLVVNLSASPFFLGKGPKRQERAQQLSHFFGTPFAYVNRVGGEDEILFDGDSFVSNGEEIVGRTKLWHSDTLILPCPTYSSKIQGANICKDKVENTWESLMEPRLVKDAQGLRLCSLTDNECFTILQALRLGVVDYAQKIGVNSFLVALSGGMDSALVLTILRLALPKDAKIEAVYMPGLFSASESYDLSYDLCHNLGVPLKTLPIKFFHSSIRNAFADQMQMPLEGLADENIQSRLRGALLYARSNQTGALVLNTSNKSELAVGYSTLYGDSVGALSLLGDLYKTEVFTLARYINKQYNNPIPLGIIDRPPSAELRENQQDSESLPPYERLDAILEGILSYAYHLNDLKIAESSREEITKIYDLIRKSEYKRTQFCPILKVKPKSLGFGHRVPLTQEWKN